MTSTVDDELQALFQELQQVQEQHATVRLSDRMAVDLVNKLMGLELLREEIIHTTNGKEYVTRGKLVEEIYNSVNDSGGRVALVALPALLAVEYCHCHAQAQVLLKEKAGEVKLVNGDLLTQKFFTNMAKEVDEMLQTAPALEVSELAQQFSLPAEQVRSCIQAHVGSLIRGSLEGSVLYTPAFLRLAKAYLRGTLRGARVPVRVGALLDSSPFPHAAIVTHKLASTLIQELMAEGVIVGSFKPAGLVFYPEVYRLAQVDAVKSFFDQNRIINYSMLTAWGISRPKQFLRETCPGGIELQTTYASQSIVTEIEALVEAGMPSCGYVDLSDMVPAHLGPNDSQALMQLARPVQACLGRGCRLLAGHFLVSSELLDMCENVATGTGVAFADRELVQQRVHGLPVTSASSDHRHQSTGQKVQGKKKRVVKNQRASHAGKDPPCGGADDFDLGGSRLQAELRSALLQQCFDDADQPCEILLDELVQAVQLVGSQARAERVEAGLSVTGQLALAAATEEVNEMLRRLVFFSRGVDALRQISSNASDDDAVAGIPEVARGTELEILEQHLMRAHGVPTADAALRLVAVHVAGCFDPDAFQGPSTTERHLAILQQLPAGLAQPAEALVRVIRHATPANIIAAIDGLLQAALVEAWERGSDMEAHALQAFYRQHLSALQAGTTSAADAFCSGILCLVAKHFNKMVIIPGRSIPFIVACLDPFINTEDRKFLDEMHRNILSLLKYTAQKARGREPADAPKWKPHDDVDKLSQLCK